MLDVVAGAVTTSCPAAAGVDADSAVHVVPSRLISTRTVATPDDVHATVWGELAIQVSPPLGAVTRMLGAFGAPPGSRKSRTTAMCCMLGAPLSLASAGARSVIGV